MATKLVKWTPRTSTGQIGRELDQIYSVVVTTDLANNVLSNSGTTSLVLQSTDASAFFIIDSFGNSASNACIFRGRKARGTVSAPAAVQNGDSLFIFSSTASYNGAAYAKAAELTFRATENWSGTGRGSAIDFKVTANGSTAVPATMLTVAGTGGVTIETGGLTVKTNGILVSSGQVNVAGDPSAAGDLSRKSYVDTQDNLRLPLAGGTMTGALTLSGDPTSALHAATKQYVDDEAFHDEIFVPANALVVDDGTPGLVSQTNDLPWWSTGNSGTTEFTWAVTPPSSWRNRGGSLNIRLYYAAPTASQQFRVDFRLKATGVNNNVDVSGTSESNTITSSSTTYGLSTYITGINETMNSNKYLISGTVGRDGGHAADTGSDMKIIGIGVVLQ